MFVFFVWLVYEFGVIWMFCFFSLLVSHFFLICIANHNKKSKKGITFLYFFIQILTNKWRRTLFGFNLFIKQLQRFDITNLPLYVMIHPTICIYLTTDCSSLFIFFLSICLFNLIWLELFVKLKKKIQTM